MAQNQQKYFDQHAETESHYALNLFKNSKETFSRVLCIPAFDETLNQLRTILEAPFNTDHLLFVLVVNAPSQHDWKNPQEKHIAESQINKLSEATQRTENLYTQLYQNYELLSQENNCSLHRVEKDRSLILVKRVADNPIPYRQGVGLARKIANDIASLLICNNIVQQKVIYNTDSDANLPKNYFTQINPENIKHKSAWVFAFEHLAEESSELLNYENAAKIYQASLEHYVKGLASAGSPYAFHTIGSCLAIEADRYIQARGFPKKNAGEDFYLLNKLRKLASVENLNNSPLILSVRPSHRVPFGTGPAIQRMSSSVRKPEAFYDPRCFVILRYYLMFWNNLPELLPDHTQSLQSVFEIFWEDHPAKTALAGETVFNWVSEHDKQLGLLKKLTQSKDKTKWQQSFLEAFDGFQTMKLINKMSKQHFPKLSQENSGF